MLGSLGVFPSRAFIPAFFTAMLIKFGHKEFFSGSWWIWFYPGLALVVLIIAINWLADILRTLFAIKE